jgi:membrane protein DedA with SNARE-associated domain/membrane-associated phospholipid phosphatase
MEEHLKTLLDWVALHPYAFDVALFVVALMESLVVLGLLIPGAALLFVAGALIATGALPLQPVMLWTILGASVGDIISYALGHHYHQRLRVIWPFRRYPALVNRGVNFFVRHGGKSVFMARFIGPLRPIVPSIAGMMNMPVARFLVIDSLACILWAPVYILPGMVFGASLGLAAEVAGRLVVLLVGVAGIAWIGVWLISSLIRLLQPIALARMDQLLTWSRNHPRIRPLAGSLLDPDHPEATGLTILAVLFFITLWLLLVILRQVLHGELFAGIDAYVFHTFSDLRTPWADSVMLFFTSLGDRKILTWIMLAACSWLLLKGCSKAVLHWLAVFGCAGLLGWILKYSTQVARPIPFDGSFSFPSSHAVMSVAVYGFLALLVARELPHTRRWLPYFGAGALIVPISLSRLYLGAHWFSDVLAGLSVGIIWVTLIGIAYDRHPAPPLPVRGLLLITLVAASMAVSWESVPSKTGLRNEYAHDARTLRITRETWRNSGWESLPAWRIDLEGRHEQPLNFQWAGTLEHLRAILVEQGWRTAPALSPLSAMNWLAPQPALDTLPVLPEVNDGQHQSLLMIAPHAPNARYLTLLRLWPSSTQLLDGKPVWIGKAGQQYLENTMPLITYLKSDRDFDKPLQELAATLQHNKRIAMNWRKRTVKTGELHWDGSVLLAW